MKVLGLLLSGVGAGFSAIDGDYACVVFAVIFVCIAAKAVRR